MKKPLQGKYVPELHRVLCPLPMKPLDVWFTLQWLEGPMEHAFKGAQRLSRANPTEVPEIPDLLVGLRLQELGRNSGEWLQHRQHGMIPPMSATAIAARHVMSAMLAAGYLFFDALRQEFQNRKLPAAASQVNPFAVWHETVNGRPINPDNYEVESFWAGLDIRNLILEDGEEAAKALAYSIVTAIEAKFRPLVVEGEA